MTFATTIPAVLLLFLYLPDLSHTFPIAFSGFHVRSVALPSVCRFAPTRYLARQRRQRRQQQQHVILTAAVSKNGEIDLKTELTLYLEKRKEANADEASIRELGRTIGGTRGNAILNFVSGSPNKPYRIGELPNIFDYDQLETYGFGHLSTPIMKAGGRQEMYNLMNITQPSSSSDRMKPKIARKLVIDRTGRTDKARYSGLKVAQILNDEEMGRRLEEIWKKRKEGLPVKERLVEEDYSMPFADKRNVSPIMTPDWTPEKLDEVGRKAGRALAWARAAKAGEYSKDPYECANIEGSLRTYCIFASLLTSFAFGRATPMVLSRVIRNDEDLVDGALLFLQVPALALVAAAIGSCLVCGIILAPTKNRNAFVWGIKGLAGGPLAIRQLQSIESLMTRREAEDADVEARKQS